MSGCFLLLFSSKTTNTAGEHKIEKLILKEKNRVPDWVKHEAFSLRELSGLKA